MAQTESSKKNFALRRLDALVGEWNVEITMPTEPPTAIDAHYTFEWLGDFFLAERSSADRADFPTGNMIIGCDDVTGAYTVLYSDSRGVARLYQMSLDDGVWKQWRESPGFSQRFTGTFSDDGNTITSYWEKSSNGETWEYDFSMTFTKAS